MTPDEARSARTTPTALRALRVLVVGPCADAQGGIGSVQRLLEQTPGAAVDLRVVCTHRDGSALRRLRAMVAGTALAAARIAVRRPDVAHMHLSQRLSVVRKGLLLLVARASGVPTVLHVHGSGFLDWFDALPAPARALVRRTLRPDRLVVLSETLRDPYAARLDVDEILVLANPVEWPAEVPARVGQDDEVVAAFLGRFGQRKGIYDVVRALALLPAGTRSRLRLVAAGDGEVEQVRAAVTAAGLDDTVTITNWLTRTDRDALLARADLLLLPSSHEGLPMAVLEAMAWGVVPVVTPVGGMPEVVHDGENGVMVPVGDPAALASALEELVADDDRRAELGDRARADVAPYGVDAWSDRLTTVWADAAA